MYCALQAPGTVHSKRRGEKMRFSITMAKEAGPGAPIVLRGSYIENIKRAAQMGYDAVEIHVNDPDTLDVEGILKACEENEIDVSTLGTGMGYVIDHLSFTDDDKLVREKAVERIKNHIDVAEKFKAKVIIGSMRGSIHDIKDYIKYENYALDCTKKVLEYAEKKEVIVLMEAINRYETNFINNVDQGIEFIDRVNSPYLKLHLDTFHMNIEEADIYKSMEKAGDILGHFHFADSNRRAPGWGHMNFKKIMESLKKIQYTGDIAFECLSLPNPEEAAQKAIEHIKSIM